jgi:D-serine deaminase-like pyridoxal phosphate-dependent protein
MRIRDLPTPALIADRDAMEENMARMNALLDGKRVRLRPHYKSNKCAAIARRQMELGAVGITCAKLSEAEDLVRNGIPDVLIANQVVEACKIERLAALAGRCRLTVCVDDPDNAGDLSRAAAGAGTTIHCLAEYDIGMDRCGVTDPAAYLALAREIAALPHLEYDGIQAYAGHVAHVVSRE